MIVCNLDPLRAIVAPNEAHPKLIIDPYAALPEPITFQHFQHVPRWNAQ